MRQFVAAVFVAFAVCGIPQIALATSDHESISINQLELNAERRAENNLTVRVVTIVKPNDKKQRPSTVIEESKRNDLEKPTS